MPLGKKIVEPPSWTNDIQWVHSTAGQVKFGPKGGKLKGGHSKQMLPSGSKIKKTSNKDINGNMEGHENSIDTLPTRDLLEIVKEVIKMKESRKI